MNKNRYSHTMYCRTCGKRWEVVQVPGKNTEINYNVDGKQPCLFCDRNLGIFVVRIVRQQIVGGNG